MSSVGMTFTATDIYHTMAPTAMTKFSRGLVSFISLHNAYGWVGVGVGLLVGEHREHITAVC